ncbi:MAG TPA: DUF3311 domain-containing protein [Blastocatellia bacterium]|nr:DUF3311 domain-containing protein [Blastocatellia bacterium]
MKRALLLIIVGALYVLHQDFWFWREARPFVFGFLPIGLFYHACYTLATALVMWLLVKHAWPSHLEEGRAEERRGDGAMERMGDAAIGSAVAPSPDPSSPRPFSRRQVTASPHLPVPPRPVASEKGGADQ